jgi:vacuolar-type H+-ATPase subunit I/STV1
LKKFSEPVYWQHLLKKTTDQEYRNSVKRVNLPVDLVADKKYKPMIETFLKDEEYRRHLIEAFENSVVYKKDKRLAKHASNLQQFRQEISDSKIKELEKKIESIQKNISCLQEIMKWAESK